MTLMGQRASNERDVHHHSISRVTIDAGAMVRVAFQPPWATLRAVLGPRWAAPVPLKFIAPRLAAPTMIRFASPTDGSRIRCRRPREPDRALERRHPSLCMLSIHRKSSTGTEVFHRVGIAVGSVDVPLRRCSPRPDRYSSHRLRCRVQEVRFRPCGRSVHPTWAWTR